MSAEAGSPITTYFRVCDGARVRFADGDDRRSVLPRAEDVSRLPASPAKADSAES